MPRPVLALPCGSMSMRRMLLPQAASAVPRLIAVVVLPTPPFWLAIATTRPSCGGLGLTITRTADSSQLDHDSVRLRQAVEHCGHHMPACARRGQFTLGPSALQEQADAVCGHKASGQLEQ